MQSAVRHRWGGVAPWTARAGGALTGSVSQSNAWYGGGMTCTKGMQSAPVFTDLWQVDVGVCLLGAGGSVC